MAILLAEDDRALARLISDFFQAAGLEVTPVHDGAAALEAAAERSFDLMILDVMMPHFDGLEVCRDALIQKVWGIDFDGDERMVDRHVAALRQKLGSAAQHIRSVYGVGYRLG